MYNHTRNMFSLDIGELAMGRKLRWKNGGAFMESFMTTSLMLTVPGQRAPESSESEINEQEQQQRGRQSAQYEYWQAVWGNGD